MVTSVLRLRVWRPCRWEREYLDVNKQRPAEVTSFQECIYSWEPFSNLSDSIIHIEPTESWGKYWKISHQHTLLKNVKLGNLKW